MRREWLASKVACVVLFWNGQICQYNDQSSRLEQKSNFRELSVCFQHIGAPVNRPSLRSILSHSSVARSLSLRPKTRPLPSPPLAARAAFDHTSFNFQPFPGDSSVDSKHRIQIHKSSFVRSSNSVSLLVKSRRSTLLLVSIVLFRIRSRFDLPALFWPAFTFGSARAIFQIDPFPALATWLTFWRSTPDRTFLHHELFAQIQTHFHYSNLLLIINTPLPFFIIIIITIITRIRRRLILCPQYTPPCLLNFFASFAAWPAMNRPFIFGISIWKSKLFAFVLFEQYTKKFFAFFQRKNSIVFKSSTDLTVIVKRAR